MKCLHIITPVKDSIDSTLETVKAIMESDILVPFTYTVYNDFSTEENTHRLEEAARQWNFRLVNLSDLTDHPSPNYLLVFVNLGISCKFSGKPWGVQGFPFI